MSLFNWIILSSCSRVTIFQKKGIEELSGLYIIKIEFYPTPEIVTLTPMLHFLNWSQKTSFWGFLLTIYKLTGL